MYEIPKALSAYLEGRTETLKQILGDGLTWMWQEFYANRLDKHQVRFPFKTRELMRACDQLDKIRKLLPPEFRNGIFSEHGVEEVRQCILDFTGVSPTHRKLALFSGYRENTAYNGFYPHYNGPDLYGKFLFPMPGTDTQQTDEKIDRIAKEYGLQRVRLGKVDILLDHGKNEIALARWSTEKFGRGYHSYVAGRVAITGTYPLPLANRIMQTLDVFPESFIITKEHALF